MVVSPKETLSAGSAFLGQGARGTALVCATRTSFFSEMLDMSRNNSAGWASAVFDMQPHSSAIAGGTSAASINARTQTIVVRMGFANAKRSSAAVFLAAALGFIA